MRPLPPDRVEVSPVISQTTEAGPASSRRTWLTVLLAVWLASAVYAFTRLDRGWVPHDEGQFGMTAERVLAGELPHRDFDEMYTGGLTYLNAFAFDLLGRNLYSLRLMLFFGFVIWVPAVYYVASRFSSPVMSGGLTLLSAVWAIPNYPAPVPSWYNLFLAVLGAAAMLRYLEDRRGFWLFTAGFCGGLSFLVKLVGLYYIAGVLLFLVFLEQNRLDPPTSVRAKRGRAFSVWLVVGLVLFAGLVVHVYQRSFRPADFLLFSLPTLATIALLVSREMRHPLGNFRARLVSLTRLWVPFLAGVLCPVVLYLLPYVASGSIESFWQGVFVLPHRRLAHAAYATPVLDLLVSGPMLALLATLLRPRFGYAGPVGLALAAGVLGAIVIGAGASIPLYRIAWQPAVFFLPIVSVFGVIHLHTVPRGDTRAPVLMLLLSITAMCSLVQFPFPAPVYFCFVAPLVALTLGALFSTRTAAARRLGGILLAFYVVFVVWRVTPGFIYAMGRFSRPAELSARLTLPRAGGLRVFSEEAQTYERVAAVVTAHANGKFIRAFPDCPEIYFLTGLQSPTRTVYDFLADPAPTDEQVLLVLAAYDVRAIVINSRPSFSDPAPESLLSQLRARFPSGEVVDRFEIRWWP